jgi:hypothetical protein
MRKIPTKSALFAMFSVLLVAACGKSSPPAIDETEVDGSKGGKGGQGGGGSGVCSPGETHPCPCDPVGDGIRMCTSDGSAFSACQCSGVTGGKAGTGGGPDTPFGQGGGSSEFGGNDAGGHSHAGQGDAGAGGTSEGGAGAGGDGLSGAGQGGAGQGGAGQSGAGQGGALPVGSKCGDPVGGEAGVGGMSQCTLATLDPCEQQENVILTDGNLVARTTTVNDAVRATAGHDHGKWYWEVTYSTKGEDSSHSGLGFGSLWSSLETGPGTEGCELEAGGLLECDTQLKPASSLAEGETVGLAVDLDQGLFYVHLASGWLNGQDPAAGVGTPFLSPRGYLEYPTITLSAGDVYRANFGQSPPVYPVPAGYESVWCGSDTLPSPPVPPGSVECDPIQGVESAYTYVPGAAADVMLLGMYQPTTGETKGPASVTVHPNSKPLTLVLSSYEPVDWQIHLDPGASLAAVYFMSFKGNAEVDSTVSGAGVNAVMLPWGGVAIQVPSPDATSLLASLEKQGIFATAARGCYVALSFTVGDNPAPSP